MEEVLIIILSIIAATWLFSLFAFMLCGMWKVMFAILAITFWPVTLLVIGFKAIFEFLLM